MGKKKGRISIDADKYVIGSGGSSNADEYNVEDCDGKVLGTATAQQVGDAMKGRPLIYKKKGWF